MMRIVAGLYRGRKIDAHDYYRPSLDRVRDNLFNIIGNPDTLSSGDTTMTANITVVLCSVRLFSPPWAAAHQEYWSRLPLPIPGDLPNVDPRIKPMSLQSPALAGGFFTTSATWESPQRKDTTAP